MHLMLKSVVCLRTRSTWGNRARTTSVSGAGRICNLGGLFGGACQPAGGESDLISCHTCTRKVDSKAFNEQQCLALVS